MSLTVAYKIDGKISTTNQPEYVVNQKLFNELFNFLTGTNCIAQGVQLIASGNGFTNTAQYYLTELDPNLERQNPGIVPTDRPCDPPRDDLYWSWYQYRKTGVGNFNSPGTWAVFRFTLADTPFDVFLHYFHGTKNRDDEATVFSVAALADSDNLVKPGVAINESLIVSGTLYNLQFVNTSSCGNRYSWEITPYPDQVLTSAEWRLEQRTGFTYLASSSLSGANQDTRYKRGGVGMQIAQRADGVDPWRYESGDLSYMFTPAKIDEFLNIKTGHSYLETINSSSLVLSGTETMWRSGSSTLAVFPISNAISGGIHLDKQKNLFPISSDSGNTGTYTMRYHFYVTKNDILVLTSDKTISTSYKFLYFGKYETLRSNHTNYLVDHSIPYVFLASHDHSNENIVPITNSGYSIGWGTQSGSNYIEGGAWHFTSSYGVVPVYLDVPLHMRLPQVNPNRLYSTPAYDSYDVGIWTNTYDVPLKRQGAAYVGKLNKLFRLAAGLSIHDTTSDLSYAIVGSNSNVSLYANDGLFKNRLLIPWDKTTAIGTTNNQYGVEGVMVI